MKNKILLNDEGVMQKNFACHFSYVREKYVYENEKNLGDIIIRGVLDPGDDRLLIPYVVTEDYQLSPEGAGRLLGRFHSAQYRTPFSSLEIPKGKMFVEEKLLSLYEAYKNDSIIKRILERAMSSCSDSVLCHGDFSPRNIIVDGSARLYLIDFEAVTLGPRAFDIAKYFWKCSENDIEMNGTRGFKTAYEMSAGCSVPQWEIDVYIFVHALLALKWLKETKIEDHDYFLFAQRTIAQQTSMLEHIV